jgi:hypothetical protein
MAIVLVRGVSVCLFALDQALAFVFAFKPAIRAFIRHQKHPAMRVRSLTADTRTPSQ